MVFPFSQQRSVFLLALVALAGVVVVPPGGGGSLGFAAATATSDGLETTMAPTTGGGAADTDDEPADSALDCAVETLGDGQCDDGSNNAACGYDRGDCCSCTCEPGEFNCGGMYNCVDPDAECVNDDDGDGGELTSAALDEDDFEAEEAEDAEGTDADGAARISPRSPVSTGVAAAAAGGAAVLLAALAL